MIEVELRGRLDEPAYDKLKQFLSDNGRLIDSHEREMFLLRDYPGYSDNPMEREVDIRLRNTSGRCEIMIKRKAANNNIAREEVSLALADGDLETAKQMAKSFGCTTAIRMHRVKDTYEYNGVEWSVVKAPKGIYYFEAEIRVETEAEIPSAEQYIRAQAGEMEMAIFSAEEMRDFMLYLDETVNEIVIL